MDETRAVARLPHLDVEVTHRRLAEEDAEQLTISLRAKPSFDAFARSLEAQPIWSWLALSPLLVWQQTMMAMWSAPRTGWPWLPARRSLVDGRGRREPARATGERDTGAIADPKVHPFPGPGGRPT